MNRREALKKLGVGSAVVVGATAVKSLPAFAFFNPAIQDLLTLTSNGTTRNGLYAQITAGTATCTGSAIPPCETCNPGDAEITAISVEAWVYRVANSGTQYGWGSNAATAASNLFPPDGTPNGAVKSFLGIPNPYIDPTVASPRWDRPQFDFRHLGAELSSTKVPDVGDVIHIYATVDFQCTYGDGVGSTQDSSDLYFTFSGTGWTASESPPL